MCNHLQLAHTYWEETLSPGDRVIDATCGNGYDTSFLAQFEVEVIAYDIQKEAIEATRAKAPKATYRLQSHASFVETEAALIIYNLGYLPGGNKDLTTMCESTLKSVRNALEIATKAVSITCYPGHPEGEREEAALVELACSLDPRKWTVCYHSWLNREKAPSLIWLVRLP
ncbi:MAG: class I SAM-dependent methyltransferase [Chlamydiales bacterium]|nr:class I SAM-dependent methyltransferase [Chlamydiales bacterium]